MSHEKIKATEGIPLQRSEGMVLVKDTPKGKVNRRVERISEHYPAMKYSHLCQYNRYTNTAN